MPSVRPTEISPPFKAFKGGLKVEDRAPSARRLRRVCRSREYLTRLFAVCILCYFSARSSAQSPIEGVTHHNWGMADGLPDKMILAIAQTPDGYLWLGTPHGLVRFDGLRFVDIGADQVPSLREFGVSSILVGIDGTLWLGSVGGGVTHLNSGAATHFGDREGFRNLSVRTLYQSPDGAIWAGTDRGLYKFERDRFTFIEPSGDQSITAIIADGADGFWVAGFGLRHYQDNHLVDVPFPAMKGVIRGLARSQDGVLWIGSVDGLMERKKDGSIQAIRAIHANVRSLAFDEKGDLWIGTIGAGVLVREKSGSILQAIGPDDPNGRVVRTIVSSHDKDIWIGSQAGLIRLSHTGMDLMKISTGASSDYGSTFVDSDSSIWLSNGIVSRLSNGQIRAINFQGIKKAIVRAVYREPSGAFWVGTLGDGAYRLVNGGVSAHYSSSKAITGFLGAPDGSVWIGTDEGLARWLNGNFTRFSDTHGTSPGTVRAMTLAPDGSIWLTTPIGLLLFRKGEYLQPEITRRMATYRIWSLFTGADGSLWLGTGTGLYVWRDGALYHIRLPQMLPQSQAIISVLQDAKGRFLVAQTTAVFRIAAIDLERSLASESKSNKNNIKEVPLISEPEIFAVGGETGAELYSDIPAVGSVDAIGGAWFASYQGLVHIGASSLPSHQMPPPIVLEKIVVDGTQISGGGPVILPPSTHNIEIQATPILLSGRTGLQLRRRLEGFDDGWSELAPGSSSSYGKLTPGQYTFIVEARWPGVEAVSTASVNIIQQSAIYRKTWFIAACLGLLALLGWLLYRARIRQMALRFQAVADERNRVAREIHDTLLQGCIGAVSLLEALEISQGQAGSHIQVGQEHRWHTIVSLVRGQFGETIKEAREAIWNLRSSEDQKPLDEALHDVVERLTTRAKIRTTLQTQGSVVRMSPRVQHELIMSAREAILNAVTHGHPSSLDVNLAIDSSQVTVSICDDGVGFDTEEVQTSASNHFGLSGMQDRMRRFGGSITIESRQGHGTKVRLTLPLHASQFRNKM